MTRWVDTGAVAVLVVAATQVQVGDSTILAILTLVIVPLAGVAWREREKRMIAERDLAAIQDKTGEGAAEVDGLKRDVRELREDVRAITRASRSREAGLFPYHSRSSTGRRRIVSRSTTRSRGSGRGSGGGSGSGTGGRT